MSKLNEWVRVNYDSLGTYTEVMDLGCIALLRHYRWDGERDDMVDLNMIEIDTQSAGLLIKSAEKNDN